MNVPVLLLDPTWRIDRVIGVEHACELLLEQRVVAASEDVATVMHSPSIEVVVPSVVARIGRLHPGESNHPPTCSHRAVRQRDRFQCQFVIDGVGCTRRGESVDHLVPRALGGASDWSNLVASCRAHNSIKGSVPFDDMCVRHGWRLRRVPFVPSRRSLLVNALRHGHPHPSWEPYLVA